MVYRATASADTREIPCFIISDMHAGAFSAHEERQLQQRFVKLLAFIRQKQARLVIAGDFFDYWQESGSRYPVEFRPLIKALGDHHHKHGAHPTLFLTGNHDHWAGKVLQNTGCILIRDHIALTTHTGLVIVLHGDGFPDLHIQLKRDGLNRFFRRPAMNMLFRLLPLAVRIQIMRKFSRQRKKRPFDPADNRDENWIEWLAGTDFRGLIFGHTHKAFLRNIERQFVVNLGTFYAHGNVGIVDQHGFSQFRVLPDGEITPFQSPLPQSD